MDTSSKHLMMDIWLKEDLGPDHLQKVGAIIDHRLTVVEKVQYKFEPMGDTWVWILSESHFSIHTYPEHSYLSLDIYICNEQIDLKGISEEILLVLPVKEVHKKCFRRGLQGVEPMGVLF